MFDILFYWYVFTIVDFFGSFGLKLFDPLIEDAEKDIWNAIGAGILLSYLLVILSLVMGPIFFIGRILDFTDWIRARLS